jgi:biofilm PGA synthesis N-glycosyltransferase PgaC
MVPTGNRQRSDSDTNLHEVEVADRRPVGGMVAPPPAPLVAVDRAPPEHGRARYRAGARRRYVPVRMKLVGALMFAGAWVGGSTWLAQPWIADLAAVTGPILAWAIVTGIALIPGFANAFVIASLAMDRRPVYPELAEPSRAVTILVAAYNEADYIADTVRSVFGQRYEAAREMIVIDDGSTDETAAIVQCLIDNGVAPAGDRLRLLRQPENGGKAAALNLGLAAARYDLIATLDGDTWLHRDALRNLVLNHQGSPTNTAATAGTVLVRNSRTNRLTRLQEWDYFMGISAVKRVQSLYQGTLVAQGAFSTYERSVLREIGGWQEVVGEDIVLTWDIIDRDYRVGYADDAIAFTRVPETMTRYFRQRKRWSRGLIEAFRRFPRVFFRPRLNLPFVYLNFTYPSLDLIYMTVFVPGVIAAVFFQVYAIAGIMTLMLVPLALLMSLVMYARQLRTFRARGLRVRSNLLGFVGYLMAYQIILSPASLAGYFAELLGRRKSW